MRLLNAKTLQFETFYGNEQPPYAVLSHRWEKREEEELRCQDIIDGTRQNTAGYSKIKACCELALKESLEYVWVDTCCIDKTNSVELQEAINSMFKWYKNSEVRYAHLSDYTVNEKQAKVVFFCRDWKLIGEKTDETICNLISSTTGINRKVLAYGDFEKCSVAERMSWASKRSTTRHEDIAYCLLGIFGVHMSLIYGEGEESAFMRLQKTIMEQSDDHSLFARRQEEEAAGHGLLASSPKPFAQSSKLIPIDYFEPRSAHGMTNRGLEIRLSLTCTLKGEGHFVTLGCAEPQEEAEIEPHEISESQVHEQRKTVPYDDRDGGDCSSAGFKKKKSKNRQIGIYIALRDDGRFTRVRLDQLVRIDPEAPRQDYKRPTLETMYFPQEVLKEEPLRENHCFQVDNPMLPTWKGKISALFVPRIKGKIFASPAKAASVGFTLDATTSPGRRKCTIDNVSPETKRGRKKPIGNISSTHAGQKSITDSRVEFDLQSGGRVGVSFEPSKKHFANEPESNILEFIAVIFGINLDGSIYGDIVGIMKNDLEAIKIESSTGSRTRDGDGWKSFLLEKYIREHEIASSAMKIEKEIWYLKFSLRIWKNYVAEDFFYQVSLSYRSK